MTFAKNGGLIIVYIRDILGHVDVSTTEVYARANMAMKQAALEKVSHISAGEKIKEEKPPYRYS